MDRKRNLNAKEAVIEKYLVDQVKKIGGMCLKWPALAQKGVPDRIIIHPNLGTVFVEVKRLGGVATKLQQSMINKINAYGGIALVVEGYGGVDAFIDFASNTKHSDCEVP